MKLQHFNHPALFALIAGTSCTQILGFDKDYEEVDTQATGAGAAAATTGAAGAGAGGMGTAGTGTTGTGTGAGGSSSCTDGTVEACYSGAPGTEGVGQCKGGMKTCTGGMWGPCVGEVLPGTETCNTPEDDNCNGQLNEGGAGCLCLPNSTAPCYTGPPGTEGIGRCHDGTQTCNPAGTAYGNCVGEVLPTAETCDVNLFDEDCDGKTNEEGTNCVCGDGYVSMDMGEECDDGNMDPTDVCTSTCQLAECGDGIVQPVLGETCDDAGTADGDPCSPTCQEQKVLELKAGFSHTCARLSGGRVKCWGRNILGQLGLGDIQNRGPAPGQMGGNLPFVELGTNKTATAIAAGEHHSCAILNDGTLKCWGNNPEGQLGAGDKLTRGDAPNEMGDSLLPVNLGTGKTAVAVAAGWGHTCAILNDGAVKCWGYNSFGQLGLGDTQSRGDGPNEMGDNLPPVDLGTGKTGIAITTQYAATCALLNDGAVKCWGNNGSGQLGLGDTQNRGDGLNEMGDTLGPVNLGNGKTAALIAGGWGHSCARLDDGTLKCWGVNGDGQLGLGDMVWRGDVPSEMGDNLPPVNLGSAASASAIASRNFHNCAVLLGGTLKCWGQNNEGRLGLGDVQTRGDEPNEMGDNLPPVDLGSGKSATAVSVGYFYSCALLSDFSVKCWGGNADGQLGQGNTQTIGVPPNETVKLFSDLW